MGVVIVLTLLEYQTNSRFKKYKINSHAIQVLARPDSLFYSDYRFGDGPFHPLHSKKWNVRAAALKQVTAMCSFTEIGVDDIMAAQHC